MDKKTWQKLYDNISPYQKNRTIVGFNVNLDRLITVNTTLLTSALFNLPEISELRQRLLHSMHICTAEEWFVTDHQEYQQLTRIFAESGPLVIGGQAGISAVHLTSEGISDVLCIARSPGPETRKILDNAGVHLLDPTEGIGNSTDDIHLIFEYTPDLIPLAKGAVPRNNRFIASPVHNPESMLIPSDKMGIISERIAQYTRMFLSGYQYLQTEEEFARAANQILLLKEKNDKMRVHVECVSVTDSRAIEGFVHYILPVADSIGLNEHELTLLLRNFCPRDTEPEGFKGLSPVQQVKCAMKVCKISGLKRLHLHTFGYFILIIRNDCAQPDASLNALLFASCTVAQVAQGTCREISSEGISAYIEVCKKLGPHISTGIFRNDTHTILMIPTIIAQEIRKSSGLGDILSSSAFVADQF